MAIITEPALKRKSAKASEPETAAQRRSHRREEIIGLVAFCAAMVVVFLMRNYAS
jgi:hypothetical protein